MMHQPHTHILNILRWPVAVFALHVIALYSGLYSYIPKLDNILHFLGGVSIAAAALSFIALAAQLHWLEIRPWWLQLFVALAIVALATVGWEFMEYILDHTIGSHMQGNITDTMSDMALALTGGAIVCAIKPHTPRTTL